jgi:hypothetical protein
VDRQVVEGPRHRAAYTLEQGVWLATCRICGFTARDVSRSSAATWFLTHIREVRRQHRADEQELRAAAAWEAEGIDVREPAVTEGYGDKRDGGDRPPPKGGPLLR